MEQTPVFVKIDEFKDILATLNTVKGKLNEAHQVLDHIEALKGKEESEFEAWKDTLHQAGEKVESLDSVLFEKK